MSFVTENVNWWFAKSGRDDDVVLSTKVTLYRNLADFPFIRKMTDDDKQRVDSLIYDAFCQEDYSFFSYDTLSDSAKKVFIDNNILFGNCSSVIINNKDEKTLKGGTRKKEKVGRNDPCPCGSGKKYKQCCGK